MKAGKKISCLLSGALFLIVPILCAEDMEEPLINCKMCRITVPLEVVNGDVVCAASFMYGAYVENPKTPDDFLNSDDLMAKLNKLPEQDRQLVSGLRDFRARKQAG